MNRLIKIALFLIAALVAQTTTQAEVIYYHTDALGTPVVATNEQGQVIWRESYTPHGTKLLNQPAAQTESRGFTGHVHDRITGLTYMGARSYDPELGRFMGIDPKGFRESDPHSFNPYVYANNNSYKYVDPDGKVAETVLDIVSLGLSIAEYNANPTIWNGIGLTYDIVATAVPLLPAGFGIIKSGSRAADALRGGDAGTDVAKAKSRDLPVLDRTGKVHGDLPKPQDLSKYEADDLRKLQRDLKQSVRERIRKNIEKGPDRAHGKRQGEEQDLIKAIEKHLSEL